MKMHISEVTFSIRGASGKVIAFVSSRRGDMDETVFVSYENQAGAQGGIQKGA
jgi:hypothetical protein